MSTQTRRRREWSLVFLLSAVLHLVVLGWFGLKRAVTDWGADAPTVNVQLVPLPRPPQRESQASSRPAAERPSRTAPERPAAAPLTTRDGDTAAAPPAAGIAIDPRWAVDMSRPQPPPRKELDPDEFQPCDPLKDPKRESKACRKVDEIAESVGRFYDPQQGKTAAAREARRNEALKRYREAPGTAGYPGIGCAILHRC